jgi:hypothetical protein
MLASGANHLSTPVEMKNKKKSTSKEITTPIEQKRKRGRPKKRKREDDEASTVESKPGKKAKRKNPETPRVEEKSARIEHVLDQVDDKRTEEHYSNLQILKRPQRNRATVTYGTKPLI